MTAPATIPAITLWQPWATWIAWGWKTIETRGHNRFKGLVGKMIAIHAGQKFDPHAHQMADGYIRQIPDGPIEQRLAYPPSYYPKGAVVCTAVVAAVGRLSNACSQRALCPCDSTRFGLELVEITDFKPIAWRGSQGIWQIPISALLFRRPTQP